MAIIQPVFYFELRALRTLPGALTRLASSSLSLCFQSSGVGAQCPEEEGVGEKEPGGPAGWRPLPDWIQPVWRTVQSECFLTSPLQSKSWYDKMKNINYTYNKMKYNEKTCFFVITSFLSLPLTHSLVLKWLRCVSLCLMLAVFFCEIKSLLHHRLNIHPFKVTQEITFVIVISSVNIHVTIWILFYLLH